MDALTLARWQFGSPPSTTSSSCPSPSASSGWSPSLHTAWYVTGQEVWKRLTKFWGKLFLINFAMGVATGIVQEFQFGMNWSEYSRFVGDVFGAPLAIEALLAFFLESTFLGLWIFGWDKLPKKAHLASIWLVAIGSNISALWILIANSFMQQPMGYVLRNGRAEMESFGALITNPHVFVQFPHVITGAMATAAFFVLGISAWHLLRAKDEETKDAFRRSFRLGAVYAFVATVAVMVVGHTQAQYMIRVQPMKMAAAEALWETENPAAMSLFTWGNEPERKDVWAVRVPGLLSFLAYNRFDGRGEGHQGHPGRVRGEVRPRRLRAAGEVDLLELPRDGGGGDGDAPPRRLGALGAAARTPSRGARGCSPSSCPRSCCPTSPTARAGSSPRSAGPPGSSSG